MKQVYSNLTTTNKESTTEFFENYFAEEGYISENQFSAVVAFFEKRAENKLAATSLALSVISVASLTNEDVMSVLDQFKNMTNSQLDQYLAYFMNLSRYPTSAIGVSNTPSTSKYVARSIAP